MRRCYCAILTAAFGALACAGCAEIKWEENIERAEQQAKAEKKPLFVFYKWWLATDSNRMETDVLSQQDVAKLFQNTVNCRIVYEFAPNRQYMAKHGVERTPGFLVQAPDGSYQKLTGYVPKDAFIRWAEAALTKGAERPNKPPPIAPKGAAK